MGKLYVKTKPTAIKLLAFCNKKALFVAIRFVFYREVLL